VAQDGGLGGFEGLGHVGTGLHVPGHRQTNLAPYESFLGIGNYWRNNSGSFAMFAAMRRASSLVSWNKT